MKKFWAGMIVGMTALSGLWWAGIAQQLGSGTGSSRWVDDVYQHKLAAARQITERKILVVAGSNALFGIDSSQLSAYWQRPAVNLGVNAGLGLPYILEVSKRVTRAGDVVLLPMEYALYLDDGTPNAQVIDHVIARDPAYWLDLPLATRWQFAAALAPERWIQGLRRLPDAPVTSGTYGAHHLNARGDQTHSAPANRTDGDKAAVRAAKTWSYGARAGNEKGGWELLEAYARWARQHGICVVAVPSVLLYRPAYDRDPLERAFYAGLAQRIQARGIPYVGSPREFMYPEEWFFDTDHHLQDWARTRHTARLVATLSQALNAAVQPRPGGTAADNFAPCARP